jgi:heme-degrading monooxygenase HmoA
MFMNVSIWQIQPGVDTESLTERANRELMPLFRRQPGFLSYQAIRQDDHLVVVHTWESREQAEAPSGVSPWVEEAQKGAMTLLHRYTGDVAVSTMK